jgi:hypothetical protein
MKRFFSFQFLIKLSQPQTWWYALGAFAIGSASGYSPVINPLEAIIVFIIYFTLPWHLLVYCIEAVHKRNSYKGLIIPNVYRRTLLLSILSLSIPFFFYLLLEGFTSRVLIAFGLVFSSTTLLRVFSNTKDFVLFQKPLLSSTELLFIGIFGFYLAGGYTLPFLTLLAAFLWIVGMFIFESTLSKEETKNSHLESEKNIFISTFLFSVASVVGFTSLSYFSFVVGASYLLLALKVLLAKKKDLVFYKRSINILTKLVVLFIIIVALLT